MVSNRIGQILGSTAGTLKRACKVLAKKSVQPVYKRLLSASGLIIKSTVFSKNISNHIFRAKSSFFKANKCILGCLFTAVQEELVHFLTIQMVHDGTFFKEHGELSLLTFFRNRV